MGLMLGVEFVTPELRDRIEVACFDRGLIILGAGASTIRWSPPLILTKENVDVALEIFDEAISRVYLIQATDDTDLFTDPCHPWLSFSAISRIRDRSRSSSTVVTRPSRNTSLPATTVKITSRPDEAKIRVPIGS